MMMNKQTFLNTLQTKLVRFGCNEDDLARIYEKVRDRVPEVVEADRGIMDDLVVQVLSSECHRFNAYDGIAVRFLDETLEASSPSSFLEAVRKIQENRDVAGQSRPLLSNEFAQFIDQHRDKIEEVFQEVRKTSHHFPLTTFGWKTLHRSYLTKTHEGVVERPDHLWFRVALFLHRDHWEATAATFRALREGRYIHATPTLFAAGMTRPQMASCFSSSTRVLTVDGYVPISEIAIGTFVLTHNFRWRRVLQLHHNQRMKRDMYNLCFYSKAPIEATLDHPFYKYNKETESYEWRHVSELAVGDWVAEADPVETRHFERHMVRGLFYSWRDVFRESDAAENLTVLVRPEKFPKLLWLLSQFRIRYQVIDDNIVRLHNITRWYPIAFRVEYLRSGSKAFDLFLKGIRLTPLYNSKKKSYHLCPAIENEIVEVARVKGYNVQSLQAGGVRISRPRPITQWWGHRVLGGRHAVRLTKKTIVDSPPDDVYTLGVEEDHSYLAEGVVVKNCFLVGMEDSVQGIYQTLADCAQVSKWAGGLGIHISSIRGKNSYIYGTNGSSNGIMPMLKVFNDTARYIDQCFAGETGVYTHRGLVPIQSLVPRKDRVLTKGGTFETVLKKLTYFLPPEELVDVAVRTPFGTLETVVMSRAHTVQWKNSAGEVVMVPLEQAGFGWKTTFATFREAPESGGQGCPFSTGDCFALGFIYRNMRPDNSTTRFRLSLKGLEFPRDDTVELFLKKHFYNAIYKPDHDDPSILILDLSMPGRSGVPMVIDFSRLGSFPEEIAMTYPIEKAVALCEGWSKGGASVPEVESSKSGLFWADYRQKIVASSFGEVVSVRRHEGPGKIVFDLEVENDKSYQTTIGLVHNGGGKRNGAFAMYLEPWHSDILEFLEAKRNVGSDEERARDLFYALWIPDLFMKCVSEGKDWHLMSPNQCPGLNKVWGKDFEKLYLQYIKDGRFVRKVKARDVWKEIMRSQIETGTPYMLYKDTCNRKSNQQNLGTIRSSNLCCEIIEYSDENEYAVCNLASISLPSCLVEDPVDARLWVYGKDDCSFCLLLKGALNDRGVSFVYRDAKSDMTEEESSRVVKGRTLPIVYADDEYVGGFTETWARFLRPRFDFDRLGEITAQLVDNLNIVIDKNAYPLEKCEISNKKHRPIGIGVQGLADVFFKMLLPYDGPEARELNQHIFECIYYHALRRSNVLAERDGPYSSFNGSPLSKGVFHFEMGAGKVSPRLNFDWESLRARIIENGTRNSLLVAPMPTASTSQILGNTESFEPLTSNLYLRRTTAGEFYVCNTMLRRVLGWLDMWNNDTIEDLVVFKGSVHKMHIPAFLKSVFRTVWEIPQKALIDMAADRQQFIDQSQSFNIYLQDQDMEKLTKIHFYGWKKGLKTGSYYVRSRAALSAVNFTVDPEKEKEKLCDSCSA